MPRYPKLEQAAERLKKAAPQQYAELVRELDELCHNLHLVLVGAEATAILSVQGRAQQANDLLTAFDPPKPNQPSAPHEFAQHGPAR